LVAGKTEDVMYPFRGGEVRDLGKFEKMMEYIYNHFGKQSSETAVMLADHPMRSKRSREDLTQHVFENLDAPSFYICMDTILNLYGSKVTTGLSVCVGHDRFSWMPISNCDAITGAFGSISLAGSGITQHLLELLQAKYPQNNFNNSHLEFLDKVKRENCFFAQNFLAELQLSGETPDLAKTIDFPDGSHVSLGAERFLAPEVLFKPCLIGKETLGIHDHIADSILASPIDTRSPLAKNIVVSSSLSKIPGFISRLKSAIQDDTDYFSMSTVKEVNVVEAPEDAVWKGAMEWWNSPDTKAYTISKENYDESGPQIVHRMCF